jgi:hypothetical protein
VAALIDRATAPLVSLMKEAFDGWWYDPGSSCSSRCLVYSLGAPFGAGPAAAAGSSVGPGSSMEGRRWLWVFFYRNLVGSSSSSSSSKGGCWLVAHAAEWAEPMLDEMMWSGKPCNARTNALTGALS